MSDSEYTPGEENKHVKKLRKTAKRPTNDSSSEEEKYIVRPTRTRKPTKPSTPMVASNVIVLESSDEEKYTVKDTKSRQQLEQPEKTTLMTLKETSDVLKINHSDEEEPKSREQQNNRLSRSLKTLLSSNERNISAARTTLMTFRSRSKN
ncbi:hypothetical protein RclHR1_08930005 [Rhizophagus clarus]|uniref:Uncharacterized protein n=1 Tax=Rhizophagus clarus TaxID=94130 RepID=A0A2Z6SH90_9GLOM|nr:hypothetical protein RclHR1_08930005 [Rhizophagus clarus]